MFQVQLSFVVNLLNVLLVWLLNSSLTLLGVGLGVRLCVYHLSVVLMLSALHIEYYCYYYYYYYYYITSNTVFLLYGVLL
jgi:hypothetical protein